MQWGLWESYAECSLLSLFPGTSPTNLRQYFTPVSTPASMPTPASVRLPAASPSMSGHASPTPEGDKPRVMFTGMIDKKGERTVRELGGELVDSVFQCTHLVTDKVS